jgi:hypothetical protein
MRMKTSSLPQIDPIDPDLDPNRVRAIITSEDLASTERALKQLASVTADPTTAASLLQLASAVRPVSHWGLNE